ncbi:DUF4429 domain-containing protein [Amycolatopsis sp. K13G38]|uniref:DUF4429 domain-containing protein n=1 Tax=Amycolatopsis acididurans TaxID=2724524 RepID=A0ABX1JF38_9PSEU|nr:DUF4429 domain-containing protein [Amycolatopsis acididurans]NKQ57121.1 DUF4429 domain-containing protein [Amycolatopsis acididurans]
MADYVLGEAVKGYGGGYVVFDGRFVTIGHKGLSRATAGKGEKRIHVSHIASVEYKPAGWAVNGYIRFSTAGSNESPRRGTGRRTTNASKDENAVIFKKGQGDAFLALRTAVENVVADHYEKS